MSAATTKIFGMSIKANPKLVLGGLAVVLAAAMWFNLHSATSDDVPVQAAAAARVSDTTAASVPLVREKGRTQRRGLPSADRGVLRIRAVDASDGRIDPTLRMDLLARLQTLDPPGPGRSLFEIGAVSPAAESAKIAGPIVPVKNPEPVASSQPVNAAPPPPTINIPLRYYGFVNPANKQEAARGLFMDGDDVLVAKEGDQLKGKYLVVALNPNHARLEDMSARQGQILPVAPEASEQQ